MNSRSNNYKKGIRSALTAGLLWGILPIYWKMLKPIDSFVIIFYRIVLVAVVCLIAARMKYSTAEIFADMKDRKQVIRYIFAGILITANWSTYIWAVNADYVIQTCIGYYIEPLMVCCFGILLFKEKLTRYKVTALLFALAGVLCVIIYYKEVPFIAIGLALTFSMYAAIKKDFNKPPVISLLYETIFLAPFALAVVIYLEVTGQGALVQGEPYQYGLLLLCGLFTAVPLAFFADADNKLDLFALGLSEYFSPTITLILGIFVFREPFEKVELIAFIIIWTGLVFFSCGEYREFKSAKEELNDPD